MRSTSDPPLTHLKPVLARLRGLQLLACLLLAIVAIQAVPSGPLPMWLEKDGPAFSAKSAAVSLPAPREQAARTVALPDNPLAPPLPPQPRTIALAAATPLAPVALPEELLARPPPRFWLSSAARPRGPPRTS